MAWALGFLLVGFLVALALRQPAGPGASRAPTPGESVAPSALAAQAEGLPPERALPLLRRAANQAPEDALLHFRLGRTYVLLRRHGEALTPFERCLRYAAPGSPLEGQASLALGKALTELGRGKEARRPLERAAFLLPQDASVDYFLGMGALLTGDQERLIKHMQRFARRGRKPDQLVVALQVLADAHESRGEVDQALAALQRLAELDPRNLVARALVTRRRAALRGPGPAFKAARSAAEARGADAGAHYALGSLYADWPGPDHGRAAIAAFGSAALLAPGDRAAALALSRELTRAGRIPEARRLLAEGLERDPQDATLVLTLADLERVAGDYGSARRRLESLVQAELSPRLRAPAEFALLASLLDEGRDEAASELLGRYTGLPPSDPRREIQAGGLARLGRFDEALAALDALIKASPSPVGRRVARTRRAKILLEAGRRDEASAAFSALISESGLQQVSVGLALWAGVALAESDLPAARALWKRGAAAGPPAGPLAWKTGLCAFLAGEASADQARVGLRLAEPGQRNDASFLLGLGLSLSAEPASAGEEWQRGLRLSARGEFPQRLIERALK